MKYENDFVWVELVKSGNVSTSLITDPNEGIDCQGHDISVTYYYVDSIS